jgi:predicted AAA+ superfamily ATPase
MDQSQVTATQQLQADVASLLLYQNLTRTEVGSAFCHLLDRLAIAQRNPSTAHECLVAYGQWFRAIATTQQSWAAYVLSYVLIDTNPFSVQAQQGQPIHPALQTAAQQDLRILQRLYDCRSEQLGHWVESVTSPKTSVVRWHDELWPGNAASLTAGEAELRPFVRDLAESRNWADQLEGLIDHYRTYGTGLFAQYRACRWQPPELVGIAYPDPTPLHTLVGYESQKQALVRNTEALLAGCPALHGLLYGSRGSGKSSLVKALLSEYGDRGLRLVEVPKANLGDLPTIVDQLRDLPQKFIIFVDDLSFEEDDDAYKALKVVLEGNVTARPANVVVYATSNRRHLVREFFGDRPRPSDADELSTWDTVQEKLSFSDRFGLTLTFEPADQTTYLEIVHHLAQEAALAIAPAELEYRALQWATRHHGRSGRTARQFIDVLQAEQGMVIKGLWIEEIKKEP